MIYLQAIRQQNIALKVAFFFFPLLILNIFDQKTIFFFLSILKKKKNFNVIRMIENILIFIFLTKINNLLKPVIWF